MICFGVSIQSVPDVLRRTGIDALKQGGYGFDSSQVPQDLLIRGNRFSRRYQFPRKLFCLIKNSNLAPHLCREIDHLQVS
jgi:hypothetical protein